MQNSVHELTSITAVELQWCNGCLACKGWFCRPLSYGLLHIHCYLHLEIDDRDTQGGFSQGVGRLTEMGASCKEFLGEMHRSCPTLWVVATFTNVYLFLAWIWLGPFRFLVMVKLLLCANRDLGETPSFGIEFRN